MQTAYQLKLSVLRHPFPFPTTCRPGREAKGKSGVVLVLLVCRTAIFSELSRTDCLWSPLQTRYACSNKVYAREHPGLISPGYNFNQTNMT
jgi:hypothetical protein